MNVIEKLNWRYATKKFDKHKKLSKTKIETLKQAFNLTATSFGLQTINMIILSSEAIRASLLEHSYHQKQVVDASHLLVICIQDNIQDTDIKDYYDNIKKVRKTSETVLKSFRENLINMMDKKSVVERQKWSTNQAYIALGNLMTVCAVEDIDACPMEGFIPSKYDEILELDKKGLKSVLLLPVGYRAEDDMFSELKKVRRPLSETIIEL